MLRVTLRNGTTRDVPVSFGHQPVYETLVADIAAANGVFRANAARRR